jgi:hypothetical protein
MGKSSPKPPPAPDYAAAAKEQGQANLEAARLTARISNPNISTPYGGQRVTFGKSTFDEAGYNKAMEAYNKQLADYEAQKASGVMAGGPAGGFPGGDYYGDFEGRGEGRGGAYPFGAFGGDFGAPPVAPTREQFTTQTDLDTPYIEQYLSPEQQKILEAQQRVELGLAGVGETALGTVQDVLGKRFAPNLRDLQTTLGGYGEVQGAPDLAGMGRATADVRAGAMPTLSMREFAPTGLPALGQYDFSGLPQAQALSTQGLEQFRGIDVNALPGLQTGVSPLQQQTELNLAGVRDVSYAPNLGMYGLSRGFIPEEQLQRTIDTSQLAAMPVQAGTTGQQAILSRVAPELQRRRQALETQLANQGIPRGSEAYNEAITEQQQQENDAIQQAALEGLRLDMAARQQGFGEAQAAAQFANQAALGQFGMGTQAVSTALGAQAARNAAQEQDFRQRVAAGQFGNEARQALFGADVTGANLANAARAQSVSEMQAAADLAARTRSQQFGEQQAIQDQISRLRAQGLSEQEARIALAGQQRSQLFGEQRDVSQIANANALEAYRALLAGQGQQFGQAMDVEAARNAALAANQATAVQQQQLANAAQLQRYNQALQAGQFGNTALQQSLQQQLALRNQPLNEIAALMSGVQVNMPQFQGYQGANVAAAPIFAGTQAAGDFAQRNYANQVANYNAGMGLLGSVAGAAGTALGGPLGGAIGAGLFGGAKPSDRRLKSNVVRVGTHPLGIGVYEYDIFGERQRGVMADEVEAVKPEAVTTHPTEGYKMVYYGML